MPPPSGAQSSLSLRTRALLATCNVRARGFTFAIVAPSSRAQAHAAQALGGRKLMTRWTVAAALGGALCGVIVAPALAQNAAQAAAMPTKLRPPKTSEGGS